MLYLPILLAIAIFLWAGGYLMTARFMSTTGVHGDELEKIITPPKWMYFICGAPVSKKYPKGDMRTVAFRIQMVAISIGLYVIWFVIARPHNFENGVALLVFFIIPLIITAYVSKHYASRHQAGVRKGRK